MTVRRLPLTVGSEAWRIDLLVAASNIIRRHPELSQRELRAKPIARDESIPFPARSREYQRRWRERRRAQRSA